MKVGDRVISTGMIVQGHTGWEDLQGIVTNIGKDRGEFTLVRVKLDEPHLGYSEPHFYIKNLRILVPETPLEAEIRKYVRSELNG